MSIDSILKEKIYIELGNLANYLNNLAIDYKLISASTASAFIYAIRENICNVPIEDKILYRQLNMVVELIIKIEFENKKITQSSFWKEILELKSLVRRKQDLVEILHHISNTIVKKELDISLDKEKKEVKRYIQIGRSERPEHGNDIVFKHDKTLSRVHLVITCSNKQFFIEDRSANGTFINGVKIEKGIKCSVEPDDEIKIGRKGTIIDMKREEIQNLIKS
jgi:hypothetical protein